MRCGSQVIASAVRAALKRKATLPESRSTHVNQFMGPLVQLEQWGIMDIIERRFSYIGPSVIKYGISYGGVVAMILSYSANKSILWMLIHGWLSWLYVLYFSLFKA